MHDPCTLNDRPLVPCGDVSQKENLNPLALVANIICGALIGLAELIPGVSGGTVALIVGVYERLLRNGTLIIERAFRKVDWAFIATIAVGMVGTVFTMSGVMHSFVEGAPELSRGLFLGMVATSIFIPIAMTDPADLRRKAPAAVGIFAVAAVLAFVGTGFTSAPHHDPSYPVIFFAAMFAVCALVLPGISGSFLLLALGLYGSIMGSLSNLEWDVIIVFIAGAFVGICVFVKFLDYLLTHHRTLTLIAMAGFMLGSLRALWPWQDSDAHLLAPSSFLPVVMAGIGSLVVLALIAWDRHRQMHAESHVVENAP